MNSQSKTKTSLLKRFEKICLMVLSVLNTNYLKDFIGQTHFQYLLIYITGLLVLETRQTGKNIAKNLGVCVHDGLTKLLLGLDFPLRKLSGFFIAWIRANRTAPGWLIIDDTSISKRFSKKIECAGFAWCSSEKRVVAGIHPVVLYWTDGHWRIPIGFRLWRPKDKCRNYQTKVTLALRLITDNVDFCRSCDYVVFDSWYCSKRFLRLMRDGGLHCISSLARNRKVIFNGKEMNLSSFAEGRSDVMKLPDYGDVKIFCTRIGKRLHYLVSTDVELSDKEVKKRYKCRWPVEEHFRLTKQRLGLGNCQCRRNKAVVNHITLVLLAYFVLEVLSKGFGCNPYEMKSIIIDEYHEHEQKLPPLKHRKEILKHVA